MARLSLSEVRRKLPELVRQAEHGHIVEITNRGRVVARLVSPANDLGTTADVLLAVRGRQRRPSRRTRDVSTRKNDHLAGLRR